MSVVIQSARADDAAAIAAIHVSSLRAAYLEHIPQDARRLVLDAPDVTRRERMWQRWLARRQTLTVVARTDRMVVGFCTLHPIRDASDRDRVGEIAAVYVLPSHWRRGIGRLLCEQILSGACARELAEVVLWVLESNGRARRFYESLGFQTDGETRVFLDRAGAPLHDVRYRRVLSRV